MSQSNHYSLASPTSLLLDDNQIIERVFSHIDNKTTDLGSEVWREPVKNYVDQERFDKEIKLLRSQPVPFCPSSALPEKGSYVSRIAAGTPILVTRDEEGEVNGPARCPRPPIRPWTTAKSARGCPGYPELVRLSRRSPRRSPPYSRVSIGRAHV